MTDRLEQLISAQVRRRPQACAIVDSGRYVSYQELDFESSRVCDTLIAHGVRPGDRVCILASKSIEAIIIMVGILKCRGTYVPLDGMNPSVRLWRMLRACKPCWLIAPPKSPGLVAKDIDVTEVDAGQQVRWLGEVVKGFELGALWEEELAETSPLPAVPSDLAYIMFTSGSTGEPKGVPITHNNVAHFVSWANMHFAASCEDRISCHSPLYFDGSVWDVFGALTSGAELHLVPRKANLLPNLLGEFIRESKLTQWASVPSVLAAMASRDVVAYGDFPELRRLIWYGEVFPITGLRYWMERLPHVEFTNLYGPTEGTIASSYHTVNLLSDLADASIPIGVPIPGKPLAVLDSNRQPVDVDVIGDLYIGGAGLSRGYWRNPGATAAAFYELPPGSGEHWYRTGDLASLDGAGVFHFHGRADRQIKSRGNRIELDEIAAALSLLPGLAETAVVAIPVEGFEGMRVCAAYVSKPGVERTPSELRTELSTRLPSYMLPRSWLMLRSLPRNQSGKVDYRLLGEYFVEEK